MISILRNSIFNFTKRIVACNGLTSSFHLLSNPNSISLPQNVLLAPVVQTIIPSNGFKVMGKVRRRCKDCYFVRREERMYVLCKTHGRHKQKSMVKDPKNTWILTHATQSKVRPW